MSKAYKKAIEIVSMATPEQCRDMIVAISKSRPSAVVGAWEMGSPADRAKYATVLDAVTAVYKASGKVEAVKKYRNLTGVPLKESLAYVTKNCIG